MTEHLPPMAGEPRSVRGQATRRTQGVCEDCDHNWHGLPCIITEPRECDCPSSFKN